MARPFKTSQTASHDWDARAEEALARAQEMPDGPERTEVMRRADLLRSGADMRRALSHTPSQAPPAQR